MLDEPRLRFLSRNRTTVGSLLKTFVDPELERQASWRETPVAFRHFRDRDGVEVDIVLERGTGVVAGVEVEAAATVVAAEFRGVRKLRGAASAHWAAGVVLYDGETTSSFGNGLFAVPICALWES